MTAFAVIPCVLAGMCRFGLRVPVMLGTVFLAGAAVEYGVDFLRKRKSPKTFWTMGLLFVCIMPPGVPLWMLVVGMMFAMVVGKEVFGGAGCYLFSPVLLGRYFLTLSYPAVMTGSYVIPAEGFFSSAFKYLDISTAGVLTREVPLVAARIGEVVPLGKLVLGGSAGCVGETVIPVVLLAGVFLLIVRAIDWRIVVGALGAFALFELTLMPEPMGWHLMAGGMLFGTFFLATDPVTSPSTGLGRAAYGVLIGSGALLMRRFGAGLEDVTLAILVGNMLVSYLNRLGREAEQVGGEGNVQLSE